MNTQQSSILFIKWIRGICKDIYVKELPNKINANFVLIIIIVRETGSCIVDGVEWSKCAASSPLIWWMHSNIWVLAWVLVPHGVLVKALHLVQLPALITVQSNWCYLTVQGLMVRVRAQLLDINLQQTSAFMLTRLMYNENIFNQLSPHRKQYCAR